MSLQVRAATNVPNLLEMSECRDRQVGTEVRALASPTSSVQWTDRHCKWLPGWGAEALFAGRSWAAEKEGRQNVSCLLDSARGPDGDRLAEAGREDKSRPFFVCLKTAQGDLKSLGLNPHAVAFDLGCHALAKGRPLPLGSVFPHHLGK